MRKALTTLVAFAMVACGNYSNDDIAFYDALPDKQALSVNVPQNGQALAQQASLYTGTVQSAQNINTGVENIIGLLDLIRTLSPTERTDTSRTWGPFRDNDVRFENRVVITRTGADTFGYALQQRPAGKGEYVSVLTGTFVGATARNGHGTLDYEAAPLISIGHPPSDPNLQSLRFVYANDSIPRTVNTTIVGKDPQNGSVGTVTYTYSEAPDVGDLDFDFTTPSAWGTFDLRIQSRWLADGGAGHALGRGTASGLPAGTAVHLEQCWDGHFAETFYDSQAGTELDGGFDPVYGPSLGCDADAGQPCPRGDRAACAL